jgi:hypothetical protein
VLPPTAAPIFLPNFMSYVNYYFTTCKLLFPPVSPNSSNLGGPPGDGSIHFLCGPSFLTQFTSYVITIIKRKFVTQYHAHSKYSQIHLVYILLTLCTANITHSD